MRGSGECAHAPYSLLVFRPRLAMEVNRLRLHALPIMEPSLMPCLPQRPCGNPGCRNMRPCEQHGRRLLDARTDANRPSSYHRGYDARWRIVRDNQLREFPLCEGCEKKGALVSAVEVDHRIPIAEDRELMYEPSNLQSLCHACHSAKTAREDGGFGNKRK